jgi:hypothetical protein
MLICPSKSNFDEQPKKIKNARLTTLLQFKFHRLLTVESIFFFFFDMSTQEEGERDSN